MFGRPPAVVCQHALHEGGRRTGDGRAVVGDAQEIYDQRIPVEDALRRIDGLYKPYHRALRKLMTRIHHEFGTAVLVDCHSMPSASGPKDEPAPRRHRDRRSLWHSCLSIIADTSRRPCGNGAMREP